MAVVPKDVFNLTNPQAGAVFGALFSAFAADRIGRRLALMANLVLYAIGAAFMTGATGSAGVGLMYAGRVLTGWGVGASTMIVPVYVAECSPPHVRGRLVGMYEVGVQFGTMIGFWLPYAVLQTMVGSGQYRIPCALQLIPAGVSIFSPRIDPSLINAGLPYRPILPHRDTPLHGPQARRS